MQQATRRVVTGHDSRGRAIVLMDGPAPNVRLRQASNLTSTLVWATDETPADVSGSADRADREASVAPPANGSVFRIVDFPPLGAGAAKMDNAAVVREMGIAQGQRGKPPRHPLMHRTRSIDYGIVLSGEMVMLLDDSEVLLRPGDVVIQQGTIHAWENRGKVNCRMAFILIDATEPPQWKAGEQA